MKQKIKNYLKFGILLFGVSLILTSCQKDDDFHSTNKNPNTINKSNYKIKNINLKDLQRNKSVFQKVSKINFKTTNKIVNDTINGFSIDTETDIYIENGNYHSYTFRIDRATPSNYLLENLVLSKKDTSYQTILYQYNITQEEFNLISQQQFVNLEGKITLTLIDNNTLSENVLGKYFFNGNCYENDYVYVEGQTCGGTGDQNHTYLEVISGQYCSQSNTVYAPTPSGYVYQSVQVACDATTGGGINNSNTPTNNNPGGINNDNHATSPNTFCSRCDDLEDPIDNSQQTPCQKIATKIASTDFSEKREILRDSTSLKKEIGFSESGNGSFNPLATSSSGHTLDFAISVSDNFVGFMHCHVDDFISDIDYGNDGLPDTIETIKIFSPRDIKNLLTLVYFSSLPSTNYSQLDAYGVMVSSEAEYMIKFTGNLSSITSNATLMNLNDDEMKKLNDKYSRKVKRNTIEKTERNYLRFIKNEIGIEGIRLFRLNNDNSIDEISLDENNNRKVTPC